MTNAEHAPVQNPEYPFLYDQIPVADGLEDFAFFVEKYPHYNFCPYVADKDARGWEESTSRVYMNQVLPNFLYVPVNIPKGDLKALDNFFDFAQNHQAILAVNITQPHKSSPVLRERYLQDANSNTNTNIDTLIRNDKGELEPYDLNSTAFVEWYKAEVGSFKDKRIVLVGVGGVGEPIAKKIAVEKPSSLLLVDVSDKTEFAKQLGKTSHSNISFKHTLEETATSDMSEDTIIINAAGKEGATNESALWKLIQKGTKGGTFVDIRPHLDIGIVKEAMHYGWRAYTGHGMNARNDYVLLQGIAHQIPHAAPPSFEEFQRLVARAS